MNFDNEGLGKKIAIVAHELDTINESRQSLMGTLNEKMDTITDVKTQLSKIDPTRIALHDKIDHEKMENARLQNLLRSLSEEQHETGFRLAKQMAQVEDTASGRMEL